MSIKMTIGKKEYEVQEDYLIQADLKFYPENPRVYSMLEVSNGTPEQEEIEELMTNLDHVKQLKESIKANGGLTDPLIVRAGDLVVLEGNSRLAAYRLLIQQDKVKWAKVKCRILPSDITDTAVFTLLGQYHIVGRKDWSPYEQAGYLYRRILSSNQPIEYIATELGIPLTDAKKFIEVYKFMIEHNDVHSLRWSYYDEYLKNRSIKKYRETMAELDQVIVKEIMNGGIRQAKDVRDYLGGIAKISGKTSSKAMMDIAAGKIDIYTAYDKVEVDGKTGNAFQIINRFRNKISDCDFKKKMIQEDKKQIKFELNKIKKTIDEFLKELD